MIGQTINQYRITRRLGAGGMGIVYLAEDTRLRCQRALKFLPANVTPDSPEHTRLVNEARALAALEHPSICPIQEIGEHGGQTFIVMSYLEGQTLKDRLETGPLPAGDALEIARQIAAALAAAHARGIVHRDVKPENVMLIEPESGATGMLRAVLMDFGIAKSRDATLATRTGTIFGTLAYMSPQQLRGEKVDAAADVWAVGVILYEMLSGRRPFLGEIDSALLYAIVSSEPEPLTGGGLEVPEAVERVIGRALAKDPADRYADAADLLADLELAAAGETVKGRRLGRRRRAPWLGAAGGLAGLLLVILFLWPGFLLTTDAVSVLAVMPLEDRSGEADQAYLAEGVADELVTSLNRIGALTIVSRQSAAKARELYASNREIRKRLGVDAVIEGSVQRSGGQVRVAVQLVSTDDDRLLWSDSYTKEMKEILNLQSEIALAISSALETELTSREEEALTRDREINPEAYNEYLLASHLHSQVTVESLQKAIEHYERAIAVEPEFAMAHIGLTDAYLLYQQMAGLPPADVADTIRHHAQRALEIDPELAEAHSTMAGVMQQFDWDFAGAVEQDARARELNPNLHTIGYAQYLNQIGRHEEAVREAEFAARQDPLNAFRQANLAGRYMRVGDYGKTLAVLDALDEWEPDYWIGLWVRGLTLTLQDKPDEAVEVLQRAASESDESLEMVGDIAHALVLAGRRAEAETILADLEARAEKEYVQPYHLAAVYAALGRADEAFAALDRAYEERSWYLLWLEPEPTGSWESLANDPRWDELIRKIGMPRR